MMNYLSLLSESKDVIETPFLSEGIPLLSRKQPVEKVSFMGYLITQEKRMERI